MNRRLFIGTAAAAAIAPLLPALPKPISWRWVAVNIYTSVGVGDNDLIRLALMYSFKCPEPLIADRTLRKHFPNQQIIVGALTTPPTNERLDGMILSLGDKQ